MHYSIETLKKLANNPHFKLNPEQLKQLEDYYASTNVKHATDVKKHPTKVDKHDPKLPEEGEQWS